MPAIRGVTVAVGEFYARTLEICLPRNMRHMAECVVVTTPQEERVKAVAARVPGVRVFETDAFTRHINDGRPAFNKGLALEEAFSFMGRHGWILIWDADILFPDDLPVGDPPKDVLHGCRRRMLEDVSKWNPDLDWRTCPHNRDGGPIGFFQLFHADALIGKEPWYDVTFRHAGGGDARFIEHFHPAKRRVMGFDVLHFGPKDHHWWGLDPVAIDTQQAYIVRNGWAASHPKVDRTACLRVPDIDERVQVPGYPSSSFDMPFVKRNRARQR
jgi:hypothetical protein